MSPQLDLLVKETVPRANAAVLEVMLRGGWWTLAELSARTRLSENTISTRISENQRRYGYAYAKRKVAHHYEYILRNA